MHIKNAIYTVELDNERVDPSFPGTSFQDDRALMLMGDTAHIRSQVGSHARREGVSGARLARQIDQSRASAARRTMRDVIACPFSPRAIARAFLVKLHDCDESC